MVFTKTASTTHSYKNCSFITIFQNQIQVKAKNIYVNSVPIYSINDCTLLITLSTDIQALYLLHKTGAQKRIRRPSSSPKIQPTLHTSTAAVRSHILYPLLLTDNPRALPVAQDWTPGREFGARAARQRYSRHSIRRRLPCSAAPPSVSLGLGSTGSPPLVSYSYPGLALQPAPNQSRKSEMSSNNVKLKILKQTIDFLQVLTKEHLYSI